MLKKYLYIGIILSVMFSIIRVYATENQSLAITDRSSSLPALRCIEPSVTLNHDKYYINLLNQSILKSPLNPTLSPDSTINPRNLPLSKGVNKKGDNQRNRSLPHPIGTCLLCKDNPTLCEKNLNYPSQCVDHFKIHNIPLNSYKNFIKIPFFKCLICNTILESNQGEYHRIVQTHLCGSRDAYHKEKS